VVRTSLTWVPLLGPSAADDTLAWWQLRVLGEKSRARGGKGVQSTYSLPTPMQASAREDGRASIANKSRS
jgi:hypothetical protein